MAHLLEKGAEVDASDKVRIDMFVGPMYRLGPMNFTRHNVDSKLSIHNVLSKRHNIARCLSRRINQRII